MTTTQTTATARGQHVKGSTPTVHIVAGFWTQGDTKIAYAPCSAKVESATVTESAVTCKICTKHEAAITAH